MAEGTSPVALVLGAGGVAGGAFHAGVLAALAEATGWDARRAELVVGTSAGSVTACGLRAGVASADLMARVCGRAVSPEAQALLAPADAVTDRSAMLAQARFPIGAPAAPSVLVAAGRRPGRVRPGAVLAGLLPPGSVSTEPISAGVDAMFGDRWPDRPTWICAVRLDTGRLTVFGRPGSPPARLGHAVAASCAIPGFFTPVAIDGVRYVDGGAHSVTNLAQVSRERCDLVVVSAPMSRTGSRRLGLAALGREMTRLTLAAEARRVRAEGTPVIAFSPTSEDLDAMGRNPMDATRSAPIAEQARISTLRRLERPDVIERLAALSS